MRSEKELDDEVTRLVKQKNKLVQGRVDRLSPDEELELAMLSYKIDVLNWALFTDFKAAIPL